MEGEAGEERRELLAIPSIGQQGLRGVGASYDRSTEYDLHLGYHRSTEYDLHLGYDRSTEYDLHLGYDCSTEYDLHLSYDRSAISSLAPS